MHVRTYSISKNYEASSGPWGSRGELDLTLQTLTHLCSVMNVCGDIRQLQSEKMEEKEKKREREKEKEQGREKDKDGKVVHVDSSYEPSASDSALSSLSGSICR